MAASRSATTAEIRTALLVAAPLAAANLGQMAMQVTNAVMVGRLGAVSLAAAGLGNAFNATLLMTAQGLLTAVAPLAAHAIGAGDNPEAGRVAGGGMIVAAALAAPMIAILIVLPRLLSGLGYETNLVTEIGQLPSFDTALYNRARAELSKVAELRVPPRDAKAFEVAAGHFFRIVSVEGPQVGDLNLWNAHDLTERFYSGKTRALHATHLSTGDRLWSTFPRLRPMATITHDTLDWYGWDEDGAGVQ